MSTEPPDRAKRLRYEVHVGADLEVEHVSTGRAEIRRMAAVVDQAGEDVRDFLTTLRESATAFGVGPEDVYTEERPRDDAWSCRLGSADVSVLRAIACSTHEYARTQRDELRVQDPEPVVERLGELCTFLSTAEETGLPVRLYQG